MSLAPLPPVRVDVVELFRLAMPLVRPFRTSFGVQQTLDRLVVRLTTAAGEGWGECVAPAAPVYSSEYTDGAAAVIEAHLVPRLAEPVSADRLAERMRDVRGHRMAKAALEMALFDAQLRAAGRSLGDHLGATVDRVPCGVSVGIPAGGAPALVEQVGRHLEEGYLRIKLKIAPGFDVEPVAAVRDAFPDAALQVDANAAYAITDLGVFKDLDGHGLELIEQPFDPGRLLHHAMLADTIATPVCLDESIVDTHTAADAIALGACSVVNIKPGRVGGLVEAVRLHDLCADRGVPVWCGGMLETGLGRAANVALAALPNFRLPGDTSASNRYFAEDLTEPFVLEDGHLAVPERPGLGRDPIPAVLDAVTTSHHRVRVG